jgi:UDP-N-acetylmuramoylalanine--D-glutamate ligase
MSKKVAILGFGLEGRAAWRYFKDQGAEITILSENQPTDVPEGVKVEYGPDIFERAMGYDIVMRTPSIRPDRIKTDGLISSGTIEFFAQCSAPIIGVTGSKGKGTTATMIRDMLQAAGKKVYLVGNIGVPALEILPELTPEDIVVFELSSFQLWDLPQSPHIAVVLMIEPEHLDVHRDFDEYKAAKATIAAHQGESDTVIYLPSNPYSLEIAEQSLAQKVPYTKAPGAEIINDALVIDGQSIINVAELPLPGYHNLENACAAVTAVWATGMRDVRAMAGALKVFEGLPHRLKKIRRVQDVTYYDDSIATTPGSAIAALQAFDQPKIIILGGSDKGADFTELAQEVTEQNVRAVILIGDTMPKLHAALQQAGFTKIYSLEHPTMNDIVQKAQSLAQSGDIVLFSPACASFDMFKSYADRGGQFIKAVQELKNN